MVDSGLEGCESDPLLKWQVIFFSLKLTVPKLNVLLQWHETDPDWSAKTAGDMFQLK